MLATSRKRSAWVLLSAVVVSALGDLLFDLYVAWTLTQHLGSVMGAAVVLASSITFRALLAFFLGGLVDRIRRRVAMVCANAGSILVLLVFLGVHEVATRTVWLAVALVLLNDAFNELFRRAYVVSASVILTSEDFVRFQARASIALRVVSTAEMLLVGLAISVLDGQTILLLDIASFALAGSLCILVRGVDGQRDVEQSRFDIRDLWEDIVLVCRRLTSDDYLRVFVILMLVLNLAYGFVPQLLPLVLASSAESVTELSWLRAGIAIGEVVGLVVVERLARHVGLLFRISMVGCGCAVLTATLGLPSPVAVASLALYGVFDSLSQPLFSYTVTRIDESVRGRVLGGIDAVILLSPSLGILVGSSLAGVSELLSGVFIFAVFMVGLLIAVANKALGGAKLVSEAEVASTPSNDSV